MFYRMLSNSASIFLVLTLFSTGYATGQTAPNNASGTILFPRDNETKDGNLLLVVSQAADPDGVQRVDMRFANSNNNINICNNNCSTRLRRPVVGINPANFSQQPGSLQMELLVTDNQNNQQVVDSVNFNWQPPTVDNVTATRAAGSITLSWDNTPGILRYNVYLSSEKNITPANINTLADSQIRRSVAATSQTLQVSDDNQVFYALVTGVNRSGESGFSQVFRIKPLANISNQDPTANEDQFTSDEDTVITGNLLSNDTDPENDPLSLSTTAVNGPQNGSLTLTADGNFSYQPNENFNGQDSFVYQLEDGRDGISQGSVTLTITPVNDAPLANSDNFSLDEDNNLTVAAPGLLSNDTDVEGEPLTAGTVAVNPPTSGNVNINADGSFTYTPEQNFFGQDSFSYSVADTNGGTSTAQVNLSINPIQDPPQANNDSVQLLEDTSISISVLDNDTDPDGDTLTITNASANNGSINIQGSQILYTPNANFNGADILTYQISDGNGNSDNANVSIQVIASNDLPTAADDVANTNEDTSVLIDVLANDTDPDGDVLTITTATATNGNVTTNGQQLNYTPQANFNGVDNISYQISDGNGGNASATVTISITPVNDNPVANDDAANTNEDTSVNIDVITNDIDVDGDNLTIVSASASNGTVTITGNNLNYSPNTNFNGIDNISYQITDGNGGIATGTVSVTVNATNDAPIAVNDSATTNEDTSVSIGVLANDSDPDGDTLTITSATATNGSVTIAGATLNYSPNLDFNGSDSISYQISDGNGGTATAVVSVIVSATNDAPVAANDSVTTDEDTSVSINVLVNDNDPDGDALTITSATATNGLVTIAGATLNYSPNLNFNGVDSINYQISDSNGGTDTASVSVTVVAINDPPIANNDVATTSEDTAVVISVLSNDSDADGDTLTITEATANSGSVTIAAGSLNYTPNANFNGSDSISYQISDGNGGTASAQVNVTVSASNDGPVAVNDSATTSEDTATTINVLSNDSDSDGDSLSVTTATATNGTVTIVANNLNYSPNLNFNGSDTINYQVTDGNNGTASAIVSVTITPVNDAPVAVNDSASTNQNTAVTITPLANDTDVDGDTLTITSATASNGSVSIVGSSLNYSPNQGFNGSDSINYQISDGNGGNASATVSVSVTNNNDSPVANNDTASTNEDTLVSVSVLSNDSDPNGDILSITSASASNGSASIAGNNINYTPNLNFNGIDSISYQISDGRGGSATATVAVTVNAVNDAPSAVNDTATTTQNTQVLINVLANDSDVDGDTLNVTSATATSGSVSVEPNQSLKYIPANNFTGNVTISYTIADTSSATASASVSVTVTGNGNAPVANNDSVSTNEDTLVNINVLANDTGSGALTVTTASATKGSVTIASDNSLNYTPNADVNGNDTISYTIADSANNNASATVNVTINSVNDVPVAVNDTATTVENNLVNINVLANDTDVDGDSLTVTNATSSNGATIVLANQNVRFTPTTGFTGNTSVNYSISDGNGGTASAVVNVTVTAGPPLIANNDTATTNEDAQVNIDVLANDSGNGDLSVTSASAPNGNLSIDSANNYRIMYLPHPNFNGSDTITYQITDSSSSTATASVTVTITPVNDAPSANNDSASTTANNSVNINVIANDTDVENDSLTVTTATATSGSVAIESNQTLTYTPNSGFSGSDTINYSISDGKGGTNSATVSVQVNNQAPTGSNDSYLLTSTEAITVPASVGVLSNDTDPESDSLTAVLVSGPSNNTSFTLNADGSFTYQHNGSNVLSDTFTYKPKDSQDGNTVAVTLTLSKPNNPPGICAGIPLSVRSGQSYSYQLQGQDADSESLTYSATNLPSWLNLNTSTGALTGSPLDSNIATTSNITLTVSDGRASNTLSNVSLQVYNDFGTNNAITVNFGNSAFVSKARDMVVDRKGNILVAGSYNESGNDLGIVRFKPDGTLDTSFSGDGLFTHDTGSFDEEITGIAIDPMNNIYLSATGGGNSDSDYYLLKLNESGSLITSFDGDGVASIDIGASTNDKTAGLVLDDFGKVTLIGHYDNSTNSKGYDIALVQYNSNGTLNTSFGTSGKLLLTANDDQFANRAMLDKEGHIYVAGSQEISADKDLLLARTSGNSWDSTFNSGNHFTYSDGGNEEAFDLIFDAKGNVLLAGNKDNDFAIFAFKLTRDVSGNDAVTLNTTDFVNGKRIKNISGTDIIYRLLPDMHGKFYALGKTGNNLAIMRILENGTLDLTYDSDGILIDSTSSGTGRATGTLHPDGQLLTTSDTNSEVKVIYHQILANSNFSCDIATQTSATKTTDTIKAVAKAANNAVYAAGESTNPADSNKDFVVFKLDSEGVADNSFGTRGVIRHDAGTGNSLTMSHAVSDSSHNILLVGYVGTNKLYVAKYDDSGEIDSNFSDGGVNNFGSGDLRLVPSATILDSSNNVYIAGKNNSSQATLLKLTSNGGSDISFAGGNISVSYSDTNFTVHDLVRTSNGSLYLIGELLTVSGNDGLAEANAQPSVAVSGTPQVSIVKYTSTGALDSSFGTGGIKTISSNSPAKAISATTNGTYLYLLVTQGVDDAAVYKLNADGDAVNSFGTSGIQTLTGFKTHSNADIQYVSSSSQLLLHLNNSSSSPRIVKLNSTGQFVKTFINAGAATLTHNLPNWDNVTGLLQGGNNELTIFGTENNDFALRQMNSLGQIINDKAEVRFDFGFGYHGYAIVLDQQSRMLVAGSAYNSTNNTSDFLYARFTNSGTADTSFNSSTAIKQEDDSGEQESYKDILLAPDNKLIVTGETFITSNANDTDVKGQRTERDQLTTEASYGSSGFKLDLSASQSSDKVMQQLQLSSGELYIVGSQDGQGVVLKLNKFGTTDSTFGNNAGTLKLNQGDSSILNAITFDQAGNLIAVGETTSSGNTSGLIIKFNSSGTLDTGFDTDGIAVFNQSSEDRFNTVAMTTQGQFLVGGESSQQLLLAQFTPAGAMYTTFNGSGYLTNDLGENDQAVKVAVDNYGKIVVAGVTNSSLVLLKYQDNGSQLLLSERFVQGDLHNLRDMVLDTLGNVYLTGTIQQNQQYKLFVVKFSGVATP